MLSLVLHPDQLEQLAAELAAARHREIGGVLVAEQLAPNVFRLVDLSVQRSGGTETCFVSDPSKHRSFLDAFFQQTGENFARFNYLGEWHSHPLCSVGPSLTDIRQMQSLVDEEPELRPIAVLLVARLAKRDRLEICPLAFRPSFAPETVDITTAPRPPGDSPARRRSWFERTFRRSPKLTVVVARAVDGSPPES
jgi:[CysO sulfur-carrier protein]-S-L-cysteine hydrolase